MDQVRHSALSFHLSLKIYCISWSRWRFSVSRYNFWIPMRSCCDFPFFVDPHCYSLGSSTNEIDHVPISRCCIVVPLIVERFPFFLRSEGFPFLGFMLAFLLDFCNDFAFLCSVMWLLDPFRRFVFCSALHCFFTLLMYEWHGSGPDFLLLLL